MPYSATAVLSILACLFVPARRGRALALLLFTLFWLPYVAYVGGDIHPGHRHLVPFVVVLTFALVDGIDLLLSWSESRSASALLASGKRLIRIAAPVGLFVAAFPFLVIQTSHPDNLQVHEETWVWNGEVTGRLLKKAFGESQPVVAVTAAGCIPYWSELPALDMLGLNDHYLPRHPPETFGEGYLGHELGDGQYVLDQAPDIICFHTGIYEGIFRSGGELQQMDEFYERYAPIRLLGRHPKEFTATVWLLRSSPKVGIHPSDTAIRIPGYLFQSDQDAPAFLGESGRLVQPLAPGRSVRIVLQTAEGADWDVDEAGISMHAGLRASVEKTEDGSAIVLSNEGAAAVELESVTLKRS